MRLNITFGLVLASVALALPRHPSSEMASVSALEGSKSGSEGIWYDRLVIIASTILDHTIMPYLTGQSALTSPSGTTCAFGLSFNPRSMACELPGRFIPTPSHPNGHGKCADGQFWFGPRQACIGEQDEIADPPVGYYCPLKWSFSAKHSCCLPDTPAAIMRNSCKNGNGAWDLIRIACVERSTNFAN